MKNVMGRKIGFWLVAALLVSASSVMAGSVPQMINYSGSLTNAGGTPVSNGNYSIGLRSITLHQADLRCGLRSGM